MRSLDCAVVGAGLAGLSFQYFDAQKPLIFEATREPGGLIKRADIPGLGRVNPGSEYIDQGHKHVISLCNKLGVPLHRLYKDSEAGLPVSFVVDGRRYSRQEFVNASKSIVSKIQSDLEVLHSDHSEAKQALLQGLVHKSVKQYIQEIKDTPKWAKDMFILVHETEYGAPSSELSAREFLESGYDRISSRSPSVYGPGYGQYVVEGGTFALIEALNSNNGSKIEFGSELESIRELSDGRYEVTFSNTEALLADRVTLALPVPSLRHLELQKSGLSPESINAIESLTYGRSVKMFFGFYANKLRGARIEPRSGEEYVDILGGTIWWAHERENIYDVLTLLRGGPSCDWEDDPDILLNYLNQIYPGIKSCWTGSFSYFEYNDSCPYSGGSWIALSPDQEQLLSDLRVPQKGIAFLGSHLGNEAGYMDGAVESAWNLRNALLRQ